MGLTQFSGTLGENAAVKLLKKKGYEILERNFRKKYGELDIIAKKDDLVVFVEVKLRSSKDFGTAAEAVTFKKQQRIIRTAKAYIVQHSLDCAFRFDVIEVYHKGLTITEVNHIESAFYA